MNPIILWNYDSNHQSQLDFLGGEVTDALTRTSFFLFLICTKTKMPLILINNNKKSLWNYNQAPEVNSKKSKWQR